MEMNKKMGTKHSALIIASIVLTASISGAAFAAKKDKGAVSFDQYHARVNTALSKRDANGDGEFTLDEYLTSSKKLSDKRRKQVTKKFNRFDKDKNGTLNKAEFKAMNKRAFSAKDANKDGVLDSSENASRNKKK